MTEGEIAAMKWITNLLFGDMLTKDLNELLDSWALIFAIVPFGALIFCGMYVGQFILDSTVLGVVLMFVFPLVAFALLYFIRTKTATRKGKAQISVKTASSTADDDLQSPMVVVCIADSSANGQQPMYALRRMNALENIYVQQGYAPSVAELKAQVGAQHKEVDWTNVVAAPPKNQTVSRNRDARAASARARARPSSR